MKILLPMLFSLSCITITSYAMERPTITLYTSNNHVLLRKIEVSETFTIGEVKKLLSSYGLPQNQFDLHARIPKQLTLGQMSNYPSEALNDEEKVLDVIRTHNTDVLIVFPN